MGLGSGEEGLYILLWLGERRDVTEEWWMASEIILWHGMERGWRVMGVVEWQWKMNVYIYARMRQQYISYIFLYGLIAQLFNYEV